MSRRQSSRVRFAVGDPDISDSSIWTCWAHSDDVYLETRYALSTVKVSLHKSGKWRVAFTEAHAPEGSDRAVYKWIRPSEFAPGWTSAFQVIVPFIGEALAGPAIPTRDVIWVNRADVGLRMNFNLLLSTSAATEIRSVLRLGDQMIGKIPRSGGGHAWIVARTEVMNSEEMGFVRGLTRDIRINTEASETVLNARLLYHAFPETVDANHTPAIYDIPVGRESLQRAPQEALS